MQNFKPGDRVRDLNHRFTPGLPETGTVDTVEASGAVIVRWDGTGLDRLPVAPATLTLER